MYTNFKLNSTGSRWFKKLGRASLCPSERVCGRAKGPVACRGGVTGKSVGPRRAPAIMTARANYERKMAHTFAEDVKRAEFSHKLHMDKIYAGNNGSDERVANKRRARVAGEQAQVRPYQRARIQTRPSFCRALKGGRS